MERNHGCDWLQTDVARVARLRADRSARRCLCEAPDARHQRPTEALAGELFGAARAHQERYVASEANEASAEISAQCAGSDH